MKLDKPTVGTDKFSVIMKYDTRVTHHHLRFGTLSESELKAHLASIPDSASNLDHVRFEDISLNGAAQ